MTAFLNTIQRELRRIIARPIYWIASIVLPLFSLVFMATIFGNGQMTDLPVGVVDADNTSASRGIVRMVDATPTLEVTHRYANETEARRAVQQKEIYGYLLIPSGYAEKVGNHEEATLGYYVHYAMLSVGGEIRSTLETLLKQVSITPMVTEAVALGEEQSAIVSFLMPTSEKEFPSYNFHRNYTIYLSQPFFFVFLQVLLLLVTIYALGRESKSGTSDDWLQTAQGNIGIAVWGKLLPYTCLFVMMGVLANGVFFEWMQIPCAGSLGVMNVVTILFIGATQALALSLYALFPVMGLIISVASMIGSLGATLSGVTFPVAFMDAPVYGASFLFPVRHFMEAVQSLLYLDGTFADYWTDIVVLLAFMCLPIPLLPRLKQAIITHRYEKFE